MKFRFTIESFSILTFLLLMPVFFSCTKDSTSMNPNLQISLTADAGVTEVWLTVQTEEAETGQQIVLRRGNNEIQRFAAVADTTVIDQGLQPAHSYSYTAQLLEGGKMLKQAIAEVTTMDTTSHDFTWQIDTIGAHSSVLNDVFIINENDIWAVGNIHLKDSTGQLIPQPFGAAHWNGQTWEIMQLPAQAPTYTSYLIPTGIFAFGPNDIWFASGGVHHFDGNQIQSFWINSFPGNPNPVLDEGQSAEKLWGTSSSNLYVVGRNGAIAYYDGQRWQKLISGTELPVQDIWGANDPQTGEDIIMCVASNKFLNEGKKVLRIEGTQVSTVSDSGLSWSLSGIWFVSGIRYYIVGAGLFQQGNVQAEDPWSSYDPGEVTAYFTNSIRGKALNDIVAAGAYGEIVHFNGLNWHNYYTETQLNTGSYFSVVMKDNLIVAVGELNRKGIVATGVR